MGVSGTLLLWVATLLGLALVSLLSYFAVGAWQRSAEKRESARRVATARVRSGYLPDELPTTARAPLGDSGPADLEGLPVDDSGGTSVVDENPRINIRYVRANGEKVSRTVRVERLDVRRGVMIVQGDNADDIRRIGLNQVTQARLAINGQRFNLGTWAEAVRAARRRRGEF